MRYLKVIIFFVIVSCIFCYPLLSHLNYSGRGDWDYFYFHHQVSQVTILDYHQFPFFNPYVKGGLSLIGNPQTRFLSPSILFTSLLGVLPGLKIEVLVHYVLGMLGMYMWMRQWGVRGLSSVIPGIIFVLSGPLALHISEGNVIWLPAAYIPYVFLFYMRGIDNKSSRDFICASLFLSLMLYEGSTYVLNFTLFIIIVFSILTSLQKKSVSPFGAMCFILLLFVLLSAPKLFPSLEFVQQFPRRTNPGSPIPLTYLGQLFISPDQSMSKFYQPAGKFLWWPFGAYIGVIPAVLFVMGCIKSFWRQWPLVICGLLTLWIGLGNFSSFSPWTILHHLPLFNSMQLPARIFIVFIFFLATIVGLYLWSVDQLFGPDNRKIQPILLIILFAVTADLVRVNSPILQESIRSFQWPPFKLTNREDFRQDELDDYENFRYRAWSGMYPVLYKNIGIINGYEPAPVISHASAQSGENYRGEYYLLNGSGQVGLRSWSPNRIVYNVSISSPDLLVVNLNYDKNWKTNAVFPLSSYNGLVARKVLPEEKTVVLFYLPMSFVGGLGALGAGLLLIIYRKRILRIS